MTYCSWQLLVCLCLAVVLAWLLPQRWQPWSIAAVTAGFMAWVAPVSLAVLTASSCLVYWSMGLKRPETGVVLAGAGGLASVFVYYKLRVDASQQAAIPLGLSYYTFRLIHYSFEAYKGKLPRHQLSEVVLYLFFLPTLIVGPIHRFGPFVRDLRRRRWDTIVFSGGLERILVGYFKVVVLANYLVNQKIVLLMPVLADDSFGQAYFDAIILWLNLYLQFSGYSDIAIGFSALVGFRVMENFNFPFIAANIKEFWMRWHISLTSWCREYVFQPVLSFSRSPLLAICMAMIILGLWHEVSLRYILWGLYHGAGIATWHFFQKIKPQGNSRQHPLLKLSGRIVATLITLNFVILSYPVTTFIQEKMLESLS
ncbi:MAG TPA: MBOAT family protein [Desulfobulbaceae bacterium]|nr:MBOAT family protein [Desulfobulbaceae bacterium]